MHCRDRRKYLEELKISNTQYVITKHIDKSHQHLHILANLVNNDGNTIKGNWIGLRSKKAAEKLTQEYQLIPAQGKNLGLTNINSLNEKERTKYKIYLKSLQRTIDCQQLKQEKKKCNAANFHTA